MGCDFEYGIQVRINGSWKTVLAWSCKDRCGGGPLIATCEFLAMNFDLWGSYGEAEALEQNKMDEEDSEADEIRREQFPRTYWFDRIPPQKCVFYSRDQLSLLISQLHVDPNHQYFKQQFASTSQLCELFLVCPLVHPVGAWCLDDGVAIIEEMTAMTGNPFLLTEDECAYLPCEMLDIINHFVYLHPAEDVRLGIYDDEGSTKSIRESEKTKQLPEKRCVVS